MLRLSLFCRPHQLPGGDISLFASTARLADDAGFYSIHLGEHMLMGEHLENYPFGTFDHSVETAWPDPFVSLATAASVTSRIRLSTGIVLAPLRPGPVLAKAIATLDVLSGGRAEPGLGVGWQREELEACGIRWNERYQRFDEVVRTCRLLWDQSPTTVPGIDKDVTSVRAFPLPAQRRIPLLMGLTPTRRNARRIAEYGDGWCPVRYSPERVRAGLDVIRDAFAEAGRNADDLVVRVQAPLVLRADGHVDVPATLAVMPEYEAAGATVLAIGPTLGCRTMAEVEGLIGEIADEASRVGTS